jgi:hypothetical protein
VTVVVRVENRYCVAWTVEVAVVGTNTTVVTVGIVLVEVSVLV